MQLNILKENKYISAIEASQKVGYASDYIGQLCRSGRIPGELRERTWYVDLYSLINHKENRQLGRRRKIFHTEADKKAAVSYAVDDRPLLPVLMKLPSNEVPHQRMNFTKRMIVLVFSMVIVFGVGSLVDYGEGDYDSSQALYFKAIESILDPLDPIVEGYTGATASEYAALLLDSSKEFGRLLHPAFKVF